MQWIHFYRHLMVIHNHGCTTIRLRTFRLQTFRYRHFVYYCIPACRTAIHTTSVSENHYFHQFQLLLTLCFRFINSTCTGSYDNKTHIVRKHCGITIQLVLSLKDANFHQFHFQLGRIPCINPGSVDIVFVSSIQLLFRQGKS